MIFYSSFFFSVSFCVWRKKKVWDFNQVSTQLKNKLLRKWCSQFFPFIHFTRVTLMYAHRFKFHLKEEVESEVEFWLLFLYIILHVHLLTKESKRKRRLGSVNRKAKDTLTGLILMSHSYSHGMKRASHYTFWHIFPIIWRKLSAREIIILCKKTLEETKRVGWR